MRSFSTALTKSSSKVYSALRNQLIVENDLSFIFFPPTETGFRNELFLLKRGRKPHDMVEISWGYYETLKGSHELCP